MTLDELAAYDRPTMKAEDVAKILGMSRGRLYDAVKRGEFPIRPVETGTRRCIFATIAVRRLIGLEGPR